MFFFFRSSEKWKIETFNKIEPFGVEFLTISRHGNVKYSKLHVPFQFNDIHWATTIYESILLQLKSFFVVFVFFFLLSFFPNRFNCSRQLRTQEQDIVSVISHILKAYSQQQQQQRPFTIWITQIHLSHYFSLRRVNKCKMMFQ